MNIGDVFNPHGLFNGIFIPDCICSLDSISWSAKACWGKLKEYAGKNGYCFPKQENLTADLGLSISTIQRSLKELDEQKFIKRKEPKGHEKLMHLNHMYVFLWHECMSNWSVRTTQNELSGHYQNELSNIKDSYIKDSSIKGLSSKEDNNETEVSLPLSLKIHRRSKGQILTNAKINLPIREKKEPKLPYQPSKQAIHLLRYW